MKGFTWLLPFVCVTLIATVASGQGRPNAPSPLDSALDGAGKAMIAGDLVLARQSVDRALSIDPGNRSARRDDAWLKLWSGHASAARLEFGSLVASDSSDTGSLLGLAAALRSLGEVARSRQIYARVLVLEPENKDAVAGLAVASAGERGEFSLTGGFITTADGRAGTSGGASVTLHPGPDVSMSLAVSREGVGSVYAISGGTIANGGSTNYIGAGLGLRPGGGPLSVVVRDEAYIGGGEFVNAVDAQGSLAVLPVVSILVGARPSYSSYLAQWRLGLRTGISLRIASHGDVLAQVLRTNGERLYGEPANLLGLSGGITKSRFRARIAVAGANERLAHFTTASVSGVWYRSERWGIEADVEAQRGMFARQSIQGGLNLRW